MDSIVPGRAGYRYRYTYTRFVPLLRCTDDECAHTWYSRAPLAESFDCEWCGEPTVVVSGYDDESDEPARIPGRPAKPESAHLANARARARKLLTEHRANTLPIPVRAIIRREGLQIEDDVDLGPALRARLVNDKIQLRPGPEYLKRFSIAHELGHWTFNTRHGDGREAEQEADAFAGELLVPGPRLLAALMETRNAAELASLFQVSQSVIRIAATTHQKGHVLDD
jgi:IrrE N-terminal-like domain